MKKIFNIKVSIWSSWKVILTIIFVTGLCTYLYNNIFIGHPNTYHMMSVLGGLYIISIVFIFKRLLYPMRIEIEDSHISFYKENILLYENTINKLQKVKVIENFQHQIIEVQLCFENQDIVLYSPLNLSSGRHIFDTIKDVSLYILKSNKFKRKKLYGRTFGFGKKFENKLVKEYWNKEYLPLTN